MSIKSSDEDYSLYLGDSSHVLCEILNASAKREERWRTKYLFEQHKGAIVVSKPKVRTF